MKNPFRPRTPLPEEVERVKRFQVEVQSAGRKYGLTFVCCTAATPTYMSVNFYGVDVEQERKLTPIVEMYAGEIADALGGSAQPIET